MGAVVGLVRMVLEFTYSSPSCGQPDERPAILANVHYLYFALILFALTCLIIAAVSFSTAPISKQHVSTTSSIHLIHILIFEIKNRLQSTCYKKIKMKYVYY